MDELDRRRAGPVTGRAARSGRPYRLNRVFAASFVLVWNGVLLWRFANGESPGPEFPVLVVLFFPAFALISSWLVFRWPYSAFGELERTPFPPSEPLSRSARIGGVAGRLRASAPFIRWSRFEEGVGFEAFGVGRGFVPFSEVTGIKRRLFGGCRVEHRSAEVRSPLAIPPSGFSRDLLRAWSETDVERCQSPGKSLN